jgi:hypothetical protein
MPACYSYLCLGHFGISQYEAQLMLAFGGKLEALQGRIGDLVM